MKSFNKLPIQPKVAIVIAVFGAIGAIFYGTFNGTGKEIINKIWPSQVASTPTVTAAPTITSTQTSTNLVANGSFEELTNGWANNWTNHGNSFSIDTKSQGNDGTNSLHLFLPSPITDTDKPHVDSDKINIDGVSTYYWKQNVKTLKASGKLTFYIDEYDEAGNEFPGRPGQWKGEINTIVNGPFVLPPYHPSSDKVKKVALQITAEPNSTFDLYIDSVTFSK